MSGTSTSADYAVQAIKGIKKVFDNSLTDMFENFKDNRVINFQSTSENIDIFTSTEGFNQTKKLSERETPPVGSLEDGYEVNISKERFGSAIEVTETMMEESGDTTTKIDNYLKLQRNAVLLDVKNRFLTDAFQFLNQGFTSTEILGPDGKTLIADDHAWNSGNTFDNKTTEKFSATEVDDAVEVGGAFFSPDGVTPRPINYDTIVVKKGSPNDRAAKRLFAENITPIQVGDINIYEGPEFTVISNPYITSTNKEFWFLMDSSIENPLYMGMKRQPTMKAPIVQNNEAVRSNVTGFWGKGIINIPYGIYGGDGTT